MCRTMVSARIDNYFPVLWQHRDVSKIPGEQAAHIREWLSMHGFQKTESLDDPREHWFRGACGVRLAGSGENYRVDILHGTDDAGWHALSEMVALRRAWDEAATLPPIELATLERSHSHGTHAAPRRNLGRWLYQNAGPPAYGVKVILQMAVGIGAVIDIVWHVQQSVSNHKGGAPFAPPIAASVLVIASALAVAAAIELAYTLFTPGPDEVLEPLMLGLTSGIFFLITENANDKLSVAEQFTAVLLGVIALGILFIIRRRFLQKEEE